MRLQQAIPYLVIFVVGFAMGWYAVLFLQNQITLATIGGVVLAAIGAWLFVRLDLVKLLLDYQTQRKEEERRVKSAVYKTVDPLLADFRRELYEAEKASNEGNSVSHSSFMLSFRKKLRDAEANNDLRHISKNAPDILKTLELIRDKVRPDPATIPINTIIAGAGSYGNLIADASLPPLIRKAINEMDDWLGEWDKWRS